jgi:aminoglycoside/choline kinase family phosphotransferase
MMDLKKFVKSYIDDTCLDKKEFQWEIVPSDGSKRIFYRLSNNQNSFIVMVNTPIERKAEKENISYLKIGEHLFSKGIPVACIYRYDLDHGWFILEDLGKTSLQEVALQSNNRIDIYKRVIELLIQIQLNGREDFNPEWCYHTKRYDRFIMEKFESNYFFTYFLQGFLGLKQDFDTLKPSFKHLSRNASCADNDFFLHRDFQSRNLIIKDDKIGVVDWQGGRLGPLQYDLASLLIDPYVGLRKEEKAILHDYYLNLLEKRLPGMSNSFTSYYPYLAIQRNLQILGAFSFLGKVQAKDRFLVYISPSLESLEGILKDIDDPELDPLKKIVDSLCG